MSRLVPPVGAPARQLSTKQPSRKGLLRLVLPEAPLAEIRRNLAAKLPESAPLFEEFSALADLKDVPILAAAIGAGTRILVTHNVRHFRSGSGGVADRVR